jgi:hypothetical protein
MVLPLIIGAYTVFDLVLWGTTGKDTITTVTGVDVYGSIIDGVFSLFGMDNSASETVSETSAFDPMIIVVAGLAMLLLYVIFKKKKSKKKVRN